MMVQTGSHAEASSTGDTAQIQLFRSLADPGLSKLGLARWWVPMSRRPGERLTRPQKAAQAPLGVLTSQDGPVIILDRGYVLGPDPHEYPAVARAAPPRRSSCRIRTT